MRFRNASIPAVALAAILMAGCTATPSPIPVLTPSVKHVEGDPQITKEQPPGSLSGDSGSSATLSTIPVSVGDVSWERGGGSGGSSQGSTVIESQGYILLLKPEQMAAYEAVGNVLGRVTEEVAESLSSSAVIDSLRLRQQYPSADITFTVELAE